MEDKSLTVLLPAPVGPMILVSEAKDCHITINWMYWAHAIIISSCAKFDPLCTGITEEIALPVRCWCMRGNRSTLRFP